MSLPGSILAAATAVATLLFAAAVRGGVRHPDLPPRDSIAVAATHDPIERQGSERNDRLYDSLRAKSSRRGVPRLIYRMLFVRPRPDTLHSDRVLDESRMLEPYAGRRIGRITVERRKPFDSAGNWFARTGNNLHALTEEGVIRRDLLFRTGDRLDPQLIVRNKQLLRSRRYIAEVEIEALPDPEDSTLVDLRIVTRDSWTISADGALHSGGRTMVALSDANIFGTGNELEVRTHFDRRDFSYGGNVVALDLPNLGGSFYDARIEAGRDFRNATLDVSLTKEFLRPTDYEVGLSYSMHKNRRRLLELDTAELVRERNVDLWGGYSHLLPAIRSSLYFTARYNYRRFPLRPYVPPALEAATNPAFHGHDLLLVGAGLYREKFYSANMVYGFGIREYLATGYKAELVGGRSWGEFGDAVYLGVTCQSGGFCQAGYIMGGFTLGSHIDLADGAWRRSAVDVDFRWFSQLFLLGRSRLRQFLGLNYTQGWNRLWGNDEVIRFTDRNGLQALDEVVYGINRLVLNTETVLFTPYQPLGFRIALFGFADFGLLGRDANIFRNGFYTSFGLGIRLKNERMIFNAVQIRLGIAFNRDGLTDSEYFRISNTTRLDQYRYRPTRPEIVAFE